MIDLKKVSEFKVLLVGDAIMDEYIYVRTVGKAIKENALSCVLEKREIFKGGVWAAAAHARNFCAQVDVMTNGQIMWNSRLVDSIYLRKLFVTHELRDDIPEDISYDIPSYDLVIITDFGHGTLTPTLIARISKQARFLAVNAQTNATNFGFNLITKYPRADLVVIDEMEARLAAHDRDSPIEDIILALGYRNIIITMGINGAIGFDGVFERSKAVATAVTDTMGAGDAFLSITAPFAASGMAMKDLLKIGNAAGAAKVKIVGHRESVDKVKLMEYLNG